MSIGGSVYSDQAITLYRHRLICSAKAFTEVLHADTRTGIKGLYGRIISTHAESAKKPLIIPVMRSPSMVFQRFSIVLALFAALPVALLGQAQSTAKPKPHVVVIGINGMELDVIRPLLLEGKMPNLSSVIKKGAYGKLRTVSAPNCPRVYSTSFTSTKPEEHGVTGFIVGGITANTNMLKQEPIWSMLSKNGVTVGMANVPATFPVMPVNGYMISGMLTRGKNCED